MNERIQELYKSCRSKEALASQEQFQSANVLLGTEVEKFAELIIQDCVTKCDAVQTMYGQYTFTARKCKESIKEHFGVE
jgi:hypothetical protein